MDKDGSLYFLSDGRRVWRIRDNREWMGEEIEDNSEELSTQCPYTRYSIQAAEEVPWKPASDDSTPIHEGAAPCISRMSDRSVVWNRTSGLP